MSIMSSIAECIFGATVLKLENRNDQQRAFDRVLRQKLFEALSRALSEYGINGGLLEAIKNMYVESSSTVRIDGHLMHLK